MRVDKTLQREGEMGLGRRFALKPQWRDGGEAGADDADAGFDGEPDEELACEV